MIFKVVVGWTPKLIIALLREYSGMLTILKFFGVKKKICQNLFQNELPHKRDLNLLIDRKYGKNSIST